ncbi:MAG: LOG family protein [Propionibacteriales bacterium]|nr:LOG family protein [Propionibacteriales bacterium]
MTRQTYEIESLTEFDAHIAGTDRLNGWFVQSVDLSGRSKVLAAKDPAGAAFLGCTFAKGVEGQLRGRGALIFPALPDLPFNPYRAELYTAEELYGDGAYADGVDAKVYAWTREAQLRHDLERSLARALHDHAITDALDEATADLDADQVIGVMGGHAVERGSATYRDAAVLGLTLARSGRTVLTGGGPGAMEAANLGAWFSGLPESGGAGNQTALDQAIAVLAQVASFRPSIDAWAEVAMEVRRRWPVGGGQSGRSIGIPTWFYGHEPPNAFGTVIAKYFTNALREDTLLARCRGGIIYLPGAAGTVQEISQAVTENYYAAHDDNVAPMVLVGRRHWTETLPAWPLLQSLGAGRTMGTRIHLVDEVSEASALLLS